MDSAGDEVGGEYLDEVLGKSQEAAVEKGTPVTREGLQKR